MSNSRRVLAAVALVPVMAILHACGVGPEEATEGEAVEAIYRTQRSTMVRFVEIDDAVGGAAEHATRRVIRSPTEYRSLFGHDAPGVDFSRQWVIFYSAGTRSTGGYDASIASIRAVRGSRSLVVTTRLESPGPSCVVTEALTTPYVLVKFDRPRPGSWSVGFHADDRVRSCEEPVGRCALVRCMAGTHCVEEGDTARCAPDAPACAATTCAEGTTCIEQPDGTAVCRATCDEDADCQMASDYCSGCFCRALGPGEQTPACRGRWVQCFRDPCQGSTAVCRNRVCELEGP